MPVVESLRGIDSVWLGPAPELATESARGTASTTLGSGPAFRVIGGTLSVIVVEEE